MRKNKMVGPIPGSGRKKQEITNTEFLNVRISAIAKKSMQSIPRMERGKLIDKLIRDYFLV